MLKKLGLTFAIIFILCFSITIFGNESATIYFPDSVGSYWVYEDQDGNEITRESVEDKVIPAETFHAFSNEPAIEEWIDYVPHLQPNRFRVEDDGITFYNNEELAKYIKSRLTKEIESLILMEPPGDDVELTYEITAETSEQMLFLPLPISLNEEWDAVNFNATLDIKVKDTSNTHDDGLVYSFSVIESGTVVDIETVETQGGTFEDCIKIEYQTETEHVGHIDGNPPGETLTTLWLASNVGIVKLHREMEDMFIKSIPGIDVPFTTAIKTLELKDFDITDTATDIENNYFPVSSGSFWVYVDQEGNELTRHALDDEVLPEKRLKAFNYKPAIENWEDYNVYANPTLYEGTADDGIVFHAGDSASKALQARLNKELDVIEEIVNRIQGDIRNDVNPQGIRPSDFKFIVDIKTQEFFEFLPNTLTLNEEWDVAKLEARIGIQDSNQNPQNRPNNRPSFRDIWDIAIVETGKVVGRESIEVPAGKFDYCLKVEFRTETTMNMYDRWQAENAGAPGEAITTLWLAPNVGIVKYHKQSENIILKAISKSSEKEEGITDEDIARFNAIEFKTLELKKYEIKAVDAKQDNEN